MSNSALTHEYGNDCAIMALKNNYNFSGITRPCGTMVRKVTFLYENAFSATAFIQACIEQLVVLRVFRRRRASTRLECEISNE